MVGANARELRGYVKYAHVHNKTKNKNKIKNIAKKLKKETMK